MQPLGQAIPVPGAGDALQRIRIGKAGQMAMRLAENAVEVRADAVGAAGRDGVAGRALLELRLAAGRAGGLQVECDRLFGFRAAA